jgi:hypothetical protein
MGIPSTIGISASGQPNAGDQANAVLSGVISGIGPSAPFAFRGPMNLALWGSFSSALTTTAASLAASVATAGALAAGANINSVNVVPGTTVKTIAGTNITLAVPPLTIHGTIESNGHLTLQPPTGPVGFATQLVGATVTLPSNASGMTLPAGTTVVAVIQNDIPATSNPPYAGQNAIVQLSNVPSNLPTVKGRIAFQFATTANIIAAGSTDAAATFTGAGIDYVGTVQLERTFDGGNTWLVCNIGSSGVLAQWSAGTPVNLTFGEPEKNVLYRLNCTAYTVTSGIALNYRISQTGGAAESLAIGPLSGG